MRKKTIYINFVSICEVIGIIRDFSLKLIVILANTPPINLLKSISEIFIKHYQIFIRGGVCHLA